MKWSVEVKVVPKQGIRDPQGEAVAGAMKSLGYGDAVIRIGKLLNLEIEAGSEQEARQRIEDACRRLLANPVIEDYSFTLHPQLRQ